MRFLVVYCHPVETSFCGALHQTVLDALDRRGHEIRDLDLYGQDFQPVLSRQERIDYHTEVRNQANVQQYVDDILWAEGLAFVYPTWWYGLPAMLKGWLDRVWIPHVTFKMPEGSQPIQPNMQHICYLLGVTTYGSPWWWIKLMQDPGRRTLMRGIGAICHPKHKATWLAHYKMDNSTAQSRAAFLQRVERCCSGIV